MKKNAKFTVALNSTPGKISEKSLLAKSIVALHSKYIRKCTRALTSTFYIHLQLPYNIHLYLPSMVNVLGH